MMKRLGNDTIATQGFLIWCRCLLCLVIAVGTDGELHQVGVGECSLLKPSAAALVFLLGLLDRMGSFGFYRCLCAFLRAKSVKAQRP